MTKLALVVGASSGVGAATARELASRGWRTVITARSRDRLAALAASIGDRCDWHAADASDSADMTTLEAFVRSRHGVPDAIFNCAGLGKWRRIEDTSPEEAARMIDAPYLAAFNASHMFIRDMLARRQGVLIHVNSPACYMPWPSAVGYTAARFALRGLHEALCQDLSGSGVHSCHAVFGTIETEYFEHNPGTRERLPKIASTIRTLSADECARVLADLAERPRREVVHPLLLLRVYHWNNRLAPGLTRWLLRTTGARH